MSSPVLLCLGFGYVAQALATRLRARGWRVIGSCRSAHKVPCLSAQGVEPLVFDGVTASPAVAAAVAQATAVLSSVPPDPYGADPVLRLHGPDLVVAPRLRWRGYLSTTAVYGDRGGGWVDEQSPLRPTGNRGRRRRDVEISWQRDAQAHVFRLAGIYGPGRNVLAAARAGRAPRLYRPAQLFNRIHVEDIARSLEAMILDPLPVAGVWNLADGHPAPAHEVTAFACTLLGVPLPPPMAAETALLSPMARSFWRDNKKVCSRLIQETLGLSLTYPDYRAGLSALHHEALLCVNAAT